MASEGRRKQVACERQIAEGKSQGLIGKAVGDVICRIFFALGGCLTMIGLLVLFFFRIQSVSGYSMIPTLRAGDVVLAKQQQRMDRSVQLREISTYFRWDYFWITVYSYFRVWDRFLSQLLDLVLFNQGQKKRLLRVIGLSNETLRYENDVLYVNEEPLDEQFILAEINEAQKNGGCYTEDFVVANVVSAGKIPADYYFVLGDNRPHATDSRSFGLVKESELVGVVKSQLLPLENFALF